MARIPHESGLGNRCGGDAATYPNGTTFGQRELRRPASSPTRSDIEATQTLDQEAHLTSKAMSLYRVPRHPTGVQIRVGSVARDIQRSAGGGVQFDYRPARIQGPGAGEFTSGVCRTLRPERSQACPYQSCAWRQWAGRRVQGRTSRGRGLFHPVPAQGLDGYAQDDVRALSAQ